MANEIMRGVNDYGAVNGYGFDAGNCGVGKDIFGFPSGGYNGAVRFLNIAINKNQSINSAFLFLPYLYVGSSGTWKWKLTGIDEDNTGSIDSGTWGRSRTTAEINFNEGEPTSGGTKTLNVKSILEEITTRGGWSNGNALGFTMTDEGSDSDVFAEFDMSECFLAYRLSAEPNFKPTAQSVSAPSLPAIQDVGIKIARPGVNVFDATEDQLYLTTRKTQVKIFSQAFVQATSTSIIQVAHNLGYTPLVSSYEQPIVSTGPTVYGSWRKLPQANAFDFDTGVVYADDTYLYIKPAYTGERFYYYIFLDQLI